MTIADFAKLCRVRRQAVEAWENGDVKKLSTLSKIAKVLNIKPIALLEIDP